MRTSALQPLHRRAPHDPWLRSGMTLISEQTKRDEQSLPAESSQRQSKQRWLCDAEDLAKQLRHLTPKSESSRSRDSLRLKMLGEPGDPAAINVLLAHRIVREMTADRVSEKFHRDAVVFQSMVQLVGLRDGHAKIACVT